MNKLVKSIKIVDNAYNNESYLRSLLFEKDFNYVDVLISNLIDLGDFIEKVELNNVYAHIEDNTARDLIGTIIRVTFNKEDLSPSSYSPCVMTEEFQYNLFGNIVDIFISLENIVEYSEQLGQLLSKYMTIDIDSIYTNIAKSRGEDKESKISNLEITLNNTEDCYLMFSWGTLKFTGEPLLLEGACLVTEMLLEELSKA